MEKLGSKGLQSFVLHPGGIRTNLLQHLTDDEMKAMGKRLGYSVIKHELLLNRFAGWYDDAGNQLENPMFTWKNITQGAATHIVAGFDPSIAGKLPYRWSEGLVEQSLTICRPEWLIPPRLPCRQRSLRATREG